MGGPVPLFLSPPRGRESSCSEDLSPLAPPSLPLPPLSRALLVLSTSHPISHALLSEYPWTRIAPRSQPVPVVPTERSGPGRVLPTRKSAGQPALFACSAAASSLVTAAAAWIKTNATAIAPVRVGRPAVAGIQESAGRRGGKALPESACTDGGGGGCDDDGSGCRAGSDSSDTPRWAGNGWWRGFDLA